MRTAEPAIETPEPAAETRGPTAETHPHLFRKPGLVYPDYWHIRPSGPCPQCDRVLTDTYSQAVVCRSIVGDVAYLRCRVCGHCFKLPTRRGAGRVSDPKA